MDVASKLQKCYEVAPPRIQQLLTAEIDFIVNKIFLQIEANIYEVDNAVVFFEMKKTNLVPHIS